MPGICKVTIIGNLGRDPEIRSTQGGDTIASLSVATSESWTDKQSGERRERTEWHRVAVFNQHHAGICEKFLKRGAKVYLEGTLQTRKWTDNQGVERYTTEVVLPRFGGELQMLSSRSDGPDGGERAYGNERRREPAMAGGGGFVPPGGGDLDGDDIPFGPQVL